MLFVLGCVLYLPFIGRDFGSKEQNPGSYFGPFVRNYEKFGIVETGGMPLGVTLLDKAEYGVPYMHHPPGLFWLLYAFGTEEWQMRLPTMLGAIIAAVLTFLLLLRYLGRFESMLAGLVVLTSPVVFFYAQVSYETILLPLGLGMMLAARALQHDELRHRKTVRFALVACAFCGPWIDWAFAFYCLALVPLLWQPRFRHTIRALLLPAAASIAALALIMVWRVWVSDLPGLPHPKASGLNALFEISVLDIPPPGQFIVACLGNLQRTYTLPVLVCAALGLWPLWRRSPRLSLALMLAGSLNVVLFASHALTHELYFAYLAPLIGASVGALWHAASQFRPTRPLIRYLTAATVLAIATMASLRVMDRASTGFFRDLGQVLTRASGPVEPDGSRLKCYHVVHSFQRYYGYYADGPFIQPYPTRDPKWMATAVGSLAKAAGARYLWLKMSGPGTEKIPWLRDMPGLAEFLVNFEQERVPELEVTLNLNGIEDWVTVDEAWLVTLKHPQ